MEQKVTTHVAKGLIIGLVLIVLSIISYIANLQNESWNKWLSNIIMFGGVIASCIIYANQMNHQVTFGNVFAHGFKTTAVITCITILFTIVFVLIMPEIKEKAMDMARQEMEKQGKLSEENIETSIGFVSKFFFPFMIGGILLGYLVLGAIASVIGAAVAKKNPLDPFAQPPM